MAAEKNKEKLAHFFYLWRNGMRAYKRRKQGLNQLKEKYIVKRLMKKWRLAFLQAQVVVAHRNHCTMRTKRKVFEWLKNQALSIKTIAQNAELLTYRTNEITLQKYFQIWRSKYRVVLEEKQKVY